MPKKFYPLKQWLTGVGVIIGLVFLTTAAKAQSVSISASANPICNGTFVTFMATPSGTSEPVTYAWYLNGTLTNSTGSTYSTPNLANGNTIVCYMFTGGFNYASNTITMTVGSLGYYYLDADGDGFGAGSPIPACTPPGSSYVTNNQDCNDSNPNIKPTATEIRCNGIDENCNGMADDTGPEIELLGLGQVIPDGSTTVRIADDTDYGSVTVGTNANHTFQISNTGTQNLTITNISATNSTEFNANQSGYTFPFVIGASSSANFIVRFTPSSGGIRTTTLSIVSNDCDEATYDIKLQGSATFVTTTTVTSSLNPSLTGSNATLTARVAALNGNPVTSGTVTFTEGVAVLAANVALNSNGQAGFSTAGLSAGSHVITATYSGAADFNISSGMITQVVNNCPTLTASPGSAIITNSTCGAGCILGGGSIAAPSGTCPIGSTLQYQLNGGAWSNSLPAYAQTGPVQTIKTRCTCDIDPTVFSPESSVTTVPGTVPALNIPANRAATVACLSLATPPTPPVVNACNGSPITPSDVVTNSPNPLTCEGTRTYTYTYSCGSNTAAWSFVYTIEREPFTVPANGAATVACLANATAPTLPTVLSHCGETLTPSAPVITDSPTSLTCEGTRTYAYTFTDCEGNTAVWSFVYTIEREPFTVPANGAATVACLANATAPMLPTVLSHCGETLTPSSPIITDSPTSLTCEGTRTYAYTFTDCEGNTAVWNFIYTIEREPFTVPANGAAMVACLANATAPTLPTVVSHCGETLTPNAPVITDSPTSLTCEGTRTYAYTFTDCEGNTAIWSFVYTIEREPFTVPTNGAATVACLANATAPTPPTVLSHCGETLTASAPVITDSPTSLTCEGTRTYAYTFTDCEGNTAIWSFVYTIEREPFTIATPNGAATVYNPALATPPTLPTVLSHCGETLTPAAPVITNAPNPLLCEGTRTYAYTYTDCEGNTATWSFVYTILDNTPPLITCPANLTVCESTMVTYMPPVGTDNCIGSVTVQIAGLPTGSVFPLGVTTNTFQVTATNSQTAVCSFTVTVNPLPTASISGTTVVCKDAPSPGIIFKGASATAPYTFTYKINNGPDLTVTSSGNTATVNAPTGTPGMFVYSLVRVVEASATQCSQNQSGTATVSVNIKPVVTLSTNAQTFIEGNTAVLCDLDDNPVNVLTPNVIKGCVAGNVVWRTQIGVGGWSEWSSTAPTTQPSNNTLYRYQAACEASCEVTYSGIISLTLNYRASTPQNVSVIADGTTIATGEEKSICDQAGNALTFNTTCATGEQLLYSVDGGVYLTQVPVQIVDGNFHNYRVRCRKSDGTASCFETESGVMRLKISTTPAAPVVSLNVTSGCGTPISFSGTANCGGLSTVWYNAATNEALPNLPTATPNETTSYYARCQGESGCQSGVSNRVTFTVVPVNTAPALSVSSDLVCTGMSVTVSANCPAGSRAEWNTGVSGNSFSVSFNNVTTQSYTARCVFENGCQSSISAIKTVRWKAFEVTLINVGQSKSAIKTNDRAAWSAQFITPDSGPSLDYSTQANPTVYHSENLNKTAPRFWTIQVETCALGTNGSLTFNMLSTPETGPVRSYNTHENNAPYFMYANREGWTELYVQNHPAYGFFADNGSGGNLYDEGLPKGLYKLGVRYWDQKGQGSIYPSTRQPAGNVLAYQEYWFRIQSKDGVGVGATRIAAENGQWITDYGFSAQVAPNPVSNTLQLKVNEAKGQKVNVSLSDATGRTLLKRNFVPETNQHQEAFEVGELANGMYFLQVNAGDKQMTLKVIKVQ